MYRLEREDFLRSRYIVLWALLGFQAGFINSFGFFACGRFVSHVTGMGTQVGLALGERNWLLSLELMLIPIFFILGSFLNGVFTSAKIDKNLKPNYDRIMLIMPIVLFLIVLLGAKGLLSDLSTSTVSQGSLFLAFLLSALCGLQNACFATLTKGQIRTTHLTGMSTDFGTDLARSFFGRLSPFEAKMLRRINFSRFATFVSFAFGAVISVSVSSHYFYLALAIPAIFSLAVYFAVSKITRQIDMKGQRSGSAVPKSELRFALENNAPDS
ncbi:MAG: YoaK family protein [Bdellovibrionota bacterium]